MRRQQWLTLGSVVAVIVVGLVLALGFVWAAMNRPDDLAALIWVGESDRVDDVVDELDGTTKDIGETLEEILAGVAASEVVTVTPEDRGNRPPYTPSTAQEVLIGPATAITLTWQGGDPDGDAVTYRVFLEAEDSMPDVLVAEQPETTYTPGTLRPGTLYYWQIQAVDAHGAATIGPVWQFKTTLDTPSFATQVVTLTNAARAEVGCPPLAINSQLIAAAEAHSKDMAEGDYLSHIGADGSTPWDRIEATDYEFTRAAENVAGGPPTPELVIAGWMESEEHRKNILNCELTEIGVGYAYLADDPGEMTYQHYWTQVFATPQE